MSSGTFPSNLTAIDTLTRPDHSYLTDGDNCFFLGEYTARKGYSHSDTNSLIFNIKKPMDRRGTPEWRWKDRAIARAALAFQNAIPSEWIRDCAFVPIPPSKAKCDPLYDDRIKQVLERIGPQLDVRELVVQAQSTAAAHESDARPGPMDIRNRYQINPILCDPEPQTLVLCDDVLTTGAHFKAAQWLLNERFPNASCVGIFIARRVPETIDFSDIMNDLPQQ